VGWCSNDVVLTETGHYSSVPISVVVVAIVAIVAMDGASWCREDTTGEGDEQIGSPSTISAESPCRIRKDCTSESRCALTSLFSKLQLAVAVPAAL
jgi:hypothetical protein